MRTSYAAPRPRSGAGRGPEGSGLYPELAALRINDGCSPNVQSEVGRQAALQSIAAARAELARRGLRLDEKTVQRLAVQLGAQMLATRTRDLERWRRGELPAGTEFAGRRIAVQIDGGRVRIRTVVKKSRVGKTRKRRKFKVEWREPKVLIVYALDERGRMDRKTRPIIDGTLRGPDALIELLAFHLHRSGAAQARQLVFLADGAPWIWARLDWALQRAGVARGKTAVFETLDWCHAMHHVSLALEDAGLDATRRGEARRRLRGLFRRGRAARAIADLADLARHRPEQSVAQRALRYLRGHHEAERLRYQAMRWWKLPQGSGAIESTIRRTINLRLKGAGTFWREEHAEALFQLRAALLSGRWEETVAHAGDAAARDRRRAWHWTPPDALAELNALEAAGGAAAQAPPCPALARPAA